MKRQYIHSIILILLENVHKHDIKMEKGVQIKLSTQTQIVQGIYVKRFQKKEERDEDILDHSKQKHNIHKSATACRNTQKLFKKKKMNVIK